MIVAAEIVVRQISQHVRHRQAFRACAAALVTHAAVVGPDLLVHDIQKLLVRRCKWFGHCAEVHFEFRDPLHKRNRRADGRIIQHPLDPGKRTFPFLCRRIVGPR